MQPAATTPATQPHTVSDEITPEYFQCYLSAPLYAITRRTCIRVMLPIERQTTGEWEEQRRIQAVEYRAITLSCVALWEPQPSTSGLGSTFQETDGSGGKNPEAGKNSN